MLDLARVRDVEAIDQFAGAGGWDVACRRLGFNPLGIEIDDAACATRAAAGLRTLKASVAELDPLDFGPVRICVASPPCPTYSSAGKRSGHRLADVIEVAARHLGEGRDTRAARIADAFSLLEPRWDWHHDPARWPAPRRSRKRRQAERSPVRRARLAARDRLRSSRLRDAEMSMLVVEPLRWALALEPDLLAWEQVPPVLGSWEFCAGILRERGWHVWTGILEAERYGVPQTRERAILMASRLGPVHPPRPTHQRYVKGEPQRHEMTLEGEIWPWVSMAEALVEGESPSPAPTGTHARKRVLEATQKNGSTREYSRRGVDEPSFTVATNADRWKFRNGNQENAAEREIDEPAPTIAFGHNAARVQWTAERPAFTILPGHNRSSTELPNGGWPSERPSTTVNGDPRISKPGRHDPEVSGSQQKDAIRVSLEEAATLQSFPAGYPFRGSRVKQFQQVGNAVPPLLAQAILAQLLSVPAQLERSAAA